jgi:hypothetical protein
MYLQKVISKKTVGILKVYDENIRIRIRTDIVSGVAPDPDSYKNVMDSQH